MPCAVVRESIDIHSLLNRGRHQAAGARILFCGDVRNHSEQKEVIFLEYEAHESMALKKIHEIVASAEKKWPIHYVEVVHRLGKMEVTECSVAIVVSCSHRREAYEASRYIIDTIKHTVPIWKKEHFTDGTSSWSKGCEACEIHEHET
ncbi:MAG: molybdenum cofactor biosynthesis protein MoaE [SAR324 cluster bacterium]|nr:molybdenum cofactor biosynthesis protein MoaE [SAR324 cluster bacterium]MBF0351348.1 molybdenum cofactor biosynthesis protein MoaE [SAR324 cluster bacterium]